MARSFGLCFGPDGGHARLATAVARKAGPALISTATLRVGPARHFGSRHQVNCALLKTKSQKQVCEALLISVIIVAAYNVVLTISWRAGIVF